MTTPFDIESFEEYLSTVKAELPSGRLYFRGHGKLAVDGHSLKPSIGRFDFLKSKRPTESEQIERDSPSHGLREKDEEPDRAGRLVPRVANPPRSAVNKKRQIGRAHV